MISKSHYIIRNEEETYFEKDLSKLVLETFLHRDHLKRMISMEQQLAVRHYHPKTNKINASLF